jgi:hypothetical protein
MNFCGKYVDGIEEFYDIEGDSIWVTENIPVDIDTTFSISETMAEWEEDALREAE